MSWHPRAARTIPRRFLAFTSVMAMLVLFPRKWCARCKSRSPHQTVCPCRSNNCARREPVAPAPRTKIRMAWRKLYHSNRAGLGVVLGGCVEIGKPTHIVSPGVVEVIIQKHRGKQAKFEGRARSEPLDDLPGAEVFFVGVGTSEVEVELVGMHFGKEVSATGEVFEVEEVVFFEAMHGFHVALVGVRSGRDAHVLAVA